MAGQNRKFLVNFNGFCVTLLVIWFALTGFAQAADSSGQVVSVRKADGTSELHLLEENSAVTFAIKDEQQVSGSFSIISTDSQKLIIKFKEKPLIKYKGKPGALRDTARSRVDLEHKKFRKDILGLENDSRNAKGKPPADIKKILKKKYKHVFNGAAVELSNETLTAVRQLSYVEAVYPDSEVKIDLNESVPLIGASQLWNDFGLTGKGIVVSIVDTGIDYAHPDLGGSAVFPSAKVIGGYDCYNNDNDPMDDHFHGTHVAGIVAANGQLKGVAYEASLMAYKVLSASGSGSFSTVIEGIELSTDPDGDPATDDGADIINMSLGGSGDPDDPLAQAVDNAVDSGVVVVVAAGNNRSYSAILSPGVARKALTVGASDKADVLASFSSKGPVPGAFSIKPDVTAPGVHITSSILGGGTKELNGTSMAAPHVAGAAALLLQNNPDLSPQDVKHIFMGTAVDIGYNVFCQGSGRVDVYEAVMSQTVISPASLSLGFDDGNQLTWEKTEYIEIENLSSDPALYTYSISLSNPLPEGIDISIPDTVTLDPLTGTANFEFNISVDNTVLPNASEAPYSYEGVLLISNGLDTHRVPFAFIKGLVLTINFDKVPGGVDAYNKTTGKYFLFYPRSTSMATLIPEGNYDFLVFFDYYNTLVLRENVDVTDITTLNISSTEAVHDLTFSMVDNAGNPLSSEYSWIFWYCLHNSGNGHGVFTRLKTLELTGNLKFSDMSADYMFDWVVSDLTINQALTHELGGRITEGIYSDIDFSNTTDEYTAIEYTYEADPNVDDLFTVHYLYHPGFGISVYYDVPPLKRDVDAEFRRTLYVRPRPRTDWFTRYSQERIYKYTGWELLYQTPYLLVEVDEPVKGYLYRQFDKPIFSTTNVDHIAVGMTPYWFGKTVTNTHALGFRPSMDQCSRFYISQWGDVPYYAGLYWELFDENGQYIQNGTGKTIFFPYNGTGKYTLAVPYEGYYCINGLPGDITTTLTFDTNKADPNPSYLQRFRVLCDGQISDSLSEGLVNEIKFDLLDDETSVEKAGLFIRPYSATDWQEVPLIVDGNSYRAVIPNLAEDDFVSMKLVAVDTAGNSLITEWHPVFYYQTNPGAPVANAGEDQQITAEYGGESAAVTLDGSTSYDPDGDIVSYLWKEGEVVLGNTAVIEATLSIGTHDILLTVTDNDEFDSYDTVQVVVDVEKVPPVANAGEDQQITVEYGSESAAVTLDGSASYDPDGDIVSYLWKEGEAILGNNAVIETTLSIGTHDISLTVTDNDGSSSYDTVQVVVDVEKVSPVANAGEDQQVSAEYGSESAAVTLDGSTSYDPDGNIVSYIWKEGEVILGNNAVIEATLSIGTHDISLTVTDNDGSSSYDTAQVVVDVEKVPPVANAGEDQQITAEYGSESAAVTLDGSTSYDPDGNIVSYIWKEGEAILGNNAVIEAALSIGTHDILLTVTDNDGSSSYDTVQVVVDIEKVPPVADAGEDQQITAEYGSESAAVTLDGSTSYDPDGDIVSYIWKEGEVILGNNAVIETTLSIGTHDISLTVTDNDGSSSYDAAQVVVDVEKVPPVANAGEDQQITAEYGSENIMVTLDGSASYDPDGNIVSHIWKEGEVVLGNNAVIEAALSIGTHDISLTVTDNDGFSSTDITQVVVTEEEPSDTLIYVQNIEMTVARKGKKWTVTAEVTIFDGSNNSVGSANVLGYWSGSVNQSVSAVTYTKGRKRIGKAKFTLSGIREPGTFTFTVNDVAKSGMTYYDALNVETSDTIVIP